MFSTPKQRAALLSIGSNSLLIVFKLVVGSLSGSVSIISEAIHSANDLLAAVVAWWSVRIADRPPDSDHPYGHGKIESISGAFEAGLIIFAAIWIIYEAIKRLINPAGVDHLWLGILVMLTSAVLNVLVSKHLYAVAEKEDSLALKADAAHLSADVYTSVGVAFGLFLVWITGWHWIDPVAAIAVALFILKIGWDLIRGAASHLMDASLPDADLVLIRQILDEEKRILNWHDLRTRKSGSQRHIDVHISIPETMTFVDAHTIADDLEQELERKLSPAHVVIHIDPAGPDGKAIR
jgi:cation diffusion facilitator family transporter